MFILRWLSVASLATLGLAHCGASDMEMAGDWNRAPNGDCNGGDCGGSGGSGGGGGDGDMPEEELEGDFEVPVATGRRVWSANPESGRVAIVDASTLQIRIVYAGFAPTHLTGIPSRREGEEQAIVINALSHDATLIRIDDSGEVETATAPVHADANAWSIGPTGRWAVAWTDARRMRHPDPTEGFQDLTLIDLEASKLTSTRLAVGYRPTQIFVNEDETRAFAVTDPGISVISLEGDAPTVLELIDVKEPGLPDAVSHVNVTPNGAWAVVRQDGSKRVSIVDLATAERVEVSLSGPVTDLDLTSDGSLAVAVVRNPTEQNGTGQSGPGSQVFILPISDVIDDPDAVHSVTLPSETVGSASLTESGDVALLYTNATPSDRLTILSLDSFTHRTVALKAPIKAVLPAPDSEHAVAILAPPEGSTKPGAFALVPVATSLPARIQATDAPILGVTISPAPSHRALVVTRGEGGQEHAAYLARLPQLQVDRIRLASPPMSTGMAPQAGMAFVAQEHPEGRLTFIHLEDGAARTLTGFELGARVVD